MKVTRNQETKLRSDINFRNSQRKEELYEFCRSQGIVDKNKNRQKEFCRSSEEGILFERDAKYGWYRYDVRFAIPVYSDAGELERYNISQRDCL